MSACEKETTTMHGFFPTAVAIVTCCFTSQALAAEPLPIYQPKVKMADIYFHHPGAKPALKYNHDVDIVKFKGRFFAAWNANEATGEDVPGQYNFLSVSDDFEHWSAPVRLFTRDAAAANPVETDNQWQPCFINWRDETLFCAWCDYNARKTYIATSTDGVRWNNREVPTSPPALTDEVVGFPTNHGLLTSKGVLMFPCSLSEVEEKCRPGHTRYAGVLLSADAGKTWMWSEPIEALPWSKLGEKPEEFGGERVTLWEPMLFEQADGKIGLLIRNSTAQDNPERAEKPHRMLLYAASSDHGRTWTKARTVEVDTICSRNYGVAHFSQKQNSLGLVLTEKLTRQPRMRLAFDVNIHRYNGFDWPVLTLGGKTRQRTALRAFFSEKKQADLFQVRLHGNTRADIAPFQMKAWNHVEFELTETGFSVSVNNTPAQSFPMPVLRKICFGGLYVEPQWPMGTQWASDMRLKLNSVVVE